LQKEERKQEKERERKRFMHAFMSRVSRTLPAKKTNKQKNKTRKEKKKAREECLNVKAGILGDKFWVGPPQGLREEQARRCLKELRVEKECNQ
jgi:hypothetical protein